MTMSHQDGFYLSKDAALDAYDTKLVVSDVYDADMGPADPIERRWPLRLPNDLDLGFFNGSIFCQKRERKALSRSTDQGIERIVIGPHLIDNIDLLRSEVHRLVSRVAKEGLEEGFR